MIDGGNATIFVSDMDRAIDFYTNTLGLKLRMRAANFWAEIEVGRDLVIGLHPKSANAPAPGTPGSVQIGLSVSEPIDDVVGKLIERGVTFSGPVVDDGEVLLAHFNDPDGNALYLVELKGAQA